MIIHWIKKTTYWIANFLCSFSKPRWKIPKNCAFVQIIPLLHHPSLQNWTFAMIQQNAVLEESCHWRRGAASEYLLCNNEMLQCCVRVCVYTDRKTKYFQLLTKIWKLLTATRIIPLWCKTPTNPIGHVHSLHTWKSPNLWTSYNTYSQVHFSCMVCMHIMFVFDLINYYFRIFK